MTTAIDSLHARLAGLRDTASAISADQAAEIEVRESIAAEEARIAAEAAKLRQLAIDQALDEAGGRHGRGGYEALDVADIGAGFFITKAPPKASYLAYQAKVEKGTKGATDDATLAAECVEAHYAEKRSPDGAITFVRSDPKDLRATFDAFPLIPTSIGNIGTRLAGFKLQNEAKRGR